MIDGGVAHNCRFAKDFRSEFINAVKENKFWPQQEITLDFDSDTDWKKLWNGDINNIKSVGVTAIRYLAHARNTLSVRVKHTTGKFFKSYWRLCLY